jgi:hypothetical protein
MEPQITQTPRRGGRVTEGVSTLQAARRAPEGHLIFSHSYPLTLLPSSFKTPAAKPLHSCVFCYK